MKNQTMICPHCHKIITVSAETPVPPQPRASATCGAANPDHDHRSGKHGKVHTAPHSQSTPTQRKSYNLAIETLLALIGAAAGVLVVWALVLDSTQVANLNTFVKALSRGDIRSLEAAFTTAVVAKFAAGLVVCSGVGVLVGIALRK